MSIIRANIDTCDKDFMLDDFNGIYDCMMIETDGDVEISQEAAAWCKNAKVGDLYEFGEMGSITIVDYEKQIIDEIGAEYEWIMKMKKEFNRDVKEYREFVSKRVFDIVNLMSEILERGRELSDKHDKDVDYFFNEFLPCDERYPFDKSFDEQMLQVLNWASDILFENSIKDILFENGIKEK